MKFSRSFSAILLQKINSAYLIYVSLDLKSSLKPIMSQTTIPSQISMSTPTVEYTSSSTSPPSIPSATTRVTIPSSAFSSSSSSIPSQSSSSSAAAAASSSSSTTVASTAAAAVAAIPQIARDVCRLPLVLLSRLRLLLRRLRRRRLRFSGRNRATRGARKESNGNAHFNGHIIGNNREWYSSSGNLGSGDGGWWWWCMWLLRSPRVLLSKVLGDRDGNVEGGETSSPSMYKSQEHARLGYRRRRRMSIPTLIILSIFSIMCIILFALTAVYKQPYWLICVLQYYHPDVLWHIPLPAVILDSPENGNDFSSNKIVALTIDDAPSRYSLEIADILRENDAHATFFVIGAQAQLRGGQPVLTRLVEQGHELGNHAMRDEAAVGLEDETLVEQIQRVDEMLVKAYAEAKVKPKVKPEAEAKDAGGRPKKRDVEAEVELAPPASRIVSAPAPVPATPDILSPSLSRRKAKFKVEPANHHPDAHPQQRLQQRHASRNKQAPSKQIPQTPRLFRPGSALFTSRMRRTLSRLNYTLVLGSIYPFDAQLSDYKRNAKHILDRVRPGAIIVCHDRRSWTPLMLRILLPELRQRGWRIGSVGEVLELQRGMEVDD